MADERLRIENRMLRRRLKSVEKNLAKPTNAKALRETACEFKTSSLMPSAEVFLEQIPACLALLNHNGCVVSCNDRFAEIVGLNAAELVNLNLRKMLPDHDWQACEQLFSSDSLSGSVDTHLVRRDHQPVPVVLSFAPIQVNARHLVALVVLEKLQIENSGPFESVVATSKANEERYRTLFNSIDEGFCVVEIIYDKESQPIDYRFVEINSVFEKQTGLHDAMGRCMRELVPNLENIWLDRYSEVSQTGISVRFTEEAKSMGRWFDVFAFRLGPKEHRRVAILFTDITAQRLAQEELKQARSRLESTLAAAEIGTWEFDPIHNTVHADQNLQKMFGVSSNQAAGGPIEDYLAVIHKEDRERVLSQITSALATGESFECDYRIVANNSIRYVVARGRVERNDQGQPIRLPGVVVNITDRRITEQRLEQVAADLSEADRRKDEFLATLAHELRNPLSPIKIAAQLMQMAKDDPSQLRELSGVIDRQVNQMVRLIDDLLDVSRISRGKMTLQTCVCDLRKVVANALEASDPFIRASGQTLHFNEPHHALYVQGDPARLTQVLVNLLNNAAKYTPAAGQIWMTVKQENDQAIMSVRDNGVGLLRSQLSRIFEMFEQIDVSKERGQAGLGIGLSLVKTLVELHGGSVEAFSDGPGTGCDFQVRLPLSSEARIESSQSDEIAFNTKTTRPFRVLVVEDTRAIRYMLVRLLKTMGHEVEEAIDGKDGLEKAIEFMPEVIFSDISMPQMNGHEFASSIRKIVRLQSVSMVALTGFGQSADRDNAIRSGFDEHMTKPADARLLSKFFAKLAADSKPQAP